MLIALLLGGSLGFGIWLTVRGLVPAAPHLAQELSEFHRPIEVAAPSEWTARLAGRLAGTATGRDADLAIVGTSAERFALDKLLLTVTGFGCPLLVVALVAAGASTIAPLAIVVVACAFFGAFGFMVPDLLLRSQAAERRREFRAALSPFVNVVTIVLAGGGGLDAALDAAAHGGDSWPFGRLRTTLAQARLSGEPAWVGLDRLASDLGVPELAELAASIALAGDSGARIRQSLDAKAASMRDHDLAAARATAESMSELMAIPTVVMLTAFVALIGYPAIAKVLSL